jgi:signal peptidase I
VAVFTSPEVEQMQFGLGRRKLENEGGGGIINAAAEIFEEKQVLLRPHVFYVKRIVGLAGERIRFSESNIFIDDKELHVPRDISPCYGGFAGYKSYKFGGEEYTIPEYTVFLLSDNLAKGKDSRQIGGVSIHNMVGRAVL